MNKRVKIDEYYYMCVLFGNHVSCVSWGKCDKILFETYGLKLINGYEYRITDDANFALFMLKHSTGIVNIFGNE